MELSDFDYQLPESLIAQRPLEQRSSSRLLIVDPAQQGLTDTQFVQWIDYLIPEDLLVFNDTRVIPARLLGTKSTGGAIELMLERLLSFDTALVQTRSSKSVKPGQVIFIEEIELSVTERSGEFSVVQRVDGASMMDLFETAGHMPLPPYIKREDEAADRERYQTIFAKTPGAVAAPTASLHFDDTFLDRLKEKNVSTAKVTLHVGAGTFQPIRSDNIEQHELHSEWFCVPKETQARIIQTREQGGRVIAVGTTVARTLESWSLEECHDDFQRDTRLFIYPGYQFKVVDALFTNFHLPQSSLLMLVCAFAGKAFALQAYEHAVKQQYRFFSYGDAMFIPNRQE